MKNLYKTKFIHWTFIVALVSGALCFLLLQFTPYYSDPVFFLITDICKYLAGIAGVTFLVWLFAIIVSR